MKNAIKLIGIIALAAVIGFSMTACPEAEEDLGKTSFGETLTLSGQIYLDDSKYDANNVPTSISYKEFKGNVTISADGGGSGSIKDGKLAYTIGKPANLETISFSSDMYDNLKISDTAVKSYTLSFDVTSGDYYSPSQGSISSFSRSGNTISSTSESVSYMYVEKDVTISGKGKTSTYTYESATSTYIYKDINLALKAGWNAIYSKVEMKTTYTDISDPSKGGTQTTTLTPTLGSPSSVKWVIREHD